MKKAEQQKFDAIMDIIANLFGRTCFMCGESYDILKKGKRRSFAVHHVPPYKTTDKKYSEYKHGTKYDRLGYYTQLLDVLIIEFMECGGDLEQFRFRFIHQGHHHRLEEFARYKPATLEKAIILIKEINQAKYNNKQA